jgi:DNA-binding response OmpR family regulator
MIARRIWKILSVDDEADYLEFIEAMLSPQYTVVSARDGSEAIPLLKQQPDLVITNLRMSKVDGFGLLAHMKKHFPHIPAIMTSASYAEENISKAKELGAEYYLVKPFEWRELRAVVEMVLPPCWCSTEDEPAVG